VLFAWMSCVGDRGDDGEAGEEEGEVGEDWELHSGDCSLASLGGLCRCFVVNI
jgi:hypothetical protein